MTLLKSTNSFPTGGPAGLMTREVITVIDPKFIGNEFQKNIEEVDRFLTSQYLKLYQRKLNLQEQTLWMVASCLQSRIRERKKEVRRTISVVKGHKEAEITRLCMLQLGSPNELSEYLLQWQLYSVLDYGHSKYSKHT